MREYFILKIPNPNSQIQKALDVSIGDNKTQRYSLDGKKVLIKTTDLRIDKEIEKGVSFDQIFPPGLTTKFSYQEALELMQSDEWQKSTVI